MQREIYLLLYPVLSINMRYFTRITSF